MSGNELVDAEATYEWHTDSALLVRDADGHECWIPFSTMCRESIDPCLDGLSKGTHIQFQAQEWILNKVGLL